MPRFARKKDTIHNAIVDTFKAFGWSVLETYRAPDLPDLFAAKDGRTVAIEVKSGNKHLTESQQAFRDTWQGEYYVVTCVEAVDRINALEVIQQPVEASARIGHSR